jgi:hypothetical protein
LNDKGSAPFIIIPAGNLDNIPSMILQLACILFKLITILKCFYIDLGNLAIEACVHSLEFTICVPLSPRFSKLSANTDFIHLEISPMFQYYSKLPIGGHIISASSTFDTGKQLPTLHPEGQSKQYCFSE